LAPHQLTFPDGGTTIGSSDRPPLLALADGDLVVFAQGTGGVDATSGKGYPGQSYEYVVSPAGQLLARDDWQISPSPLDNQLFVLAGPSDTTWSVIDSSGAEHATGISSNYGLLSSDPSGHVWAFEHSGNGADLLAEYPSERSSSAQSIDYGSSSIAAATPACDSTLWLVTGPGEVEHIVGGDVTRLVTLGFEDGGAPTLVAAGAGGEMWVVGSDAAG